MTITQRKRQLRMAVRRDEQLISICDRARSDQAVAMQVLALPEYRRAQSLFCFVSTTREIDTTPVLLDALHSGKTLCVPLCVDDGIMEPRQITSLDQLHRGAYGVLEPEEDTLKMTLDQVDLSIIPCVSCDRLGHRLGQGTGFYDRFFAGNPENAAMLCRESLLRTIIPREPHDVVFPLVITEFGVYRKGVLDLGRRSPAFRVWA